MAGARERARRFVLRIRTQAILLSVVPLTFLVLLCVIAGVLQNRTEATAVWAQRSTNALTEADAIQKTLTESNRAVADYVLQPRPATLEPYRAGLGALTDHIARLKGLASDDPVQARRAAGYGTLSVDVYGVLGSHLKLWQAGRKTEAQKMVSSPQVQRLTANWEAARNDFGLHERQKALTRYAALHQDLITIGAMLIGVSLLGTIATLFVTARFGLRIARRLLQLAENARRLGRGEDTEAIGGGDEITDLDCVYHDMTERLQETLHEREEALLAYERAHHVASTLQRALLPQELPHVAGLVFDGAYVPGRADEQVGGDWYDALTLSDGRVLITIGEVAGSGLQAAVIMASMRQVIRGVAQVYADPATMVDASDRTLKAEHPDSLVTAFVAVFDPVVRTLSYCSAGHPAPLLRRADGTVGELPSRGLPLGLPARGDADARTVDIPDGGAARAKAVFAEPLEIKGREIRITASQGIVDVERAYERAEDILRDAEIAMYASKRQARGSFQVFSASMRQQVELDAQLEHDLHHAIAADEFRVRAAGRPADPHRPRRRQHRSGHRHRAQRWIALAARPEHQARADSRFRAVPDGIQRHRPEGTRE